MSNLWAVHAYESMYGGYQGIEDYAVIEAISEDEVNDIATSMSFEVIESYTESEIIEDIKKEYEYDTDEFWDAVEEAKNESVSYEYYKITEPTTASLEELNDLFSNNPDSFIEKYCKE